MTFEDYREEFEKEPELEAELDMFGVVIYERAGYWIAFCKFLYNKLKEYENENKSM